MAKLKDILERDDIPDDIEVTLTPRDYQLEDIKTLVPLKRCSNFSEVGTGKSLVSYIWAMDRLFSGKKVLVVMPPALIEQYLGKFSVIQGHPFTMSRLNKDKKKRDKEMAEWRANGWPDVLGMSYQLFCKYFKELKHYHALIADEAHCLSNASTSTFQAVFYTLLRGDMDFLEMTATPCLTELRSAYGHIRLKTPHAYKDLAHFDRQHVIYQISDERVATIVGYNKIEEIEGHLNAYSVRRRADDVLTLQTPTLIDHEVLLSYQHTELYLTLLTERMLALGGDELIIARNKSALRQMALQLITNVENFTEDRLQDDEPLENLKTILESLADKKVVVFAHFVATIEKLAKVFKHLNPAVVYGGSDAPSNVAKFVEDPTCRLILMNYRSGGAGVDGLQLVSNHMVFYEPTGSPGDITQAFGRLQRSGQEKAVMGWVFRYVLSGGPKTLSNKLLLKAELRSIGIKKVLNDVISVLDYMS
jgi:SNF2 family DNA or RNA helicase